MERTREGDGEKRQEEGNERRRRIKKMREMELLDVERKS